MIGRLAAAAIFAVAFSPLQLLAQDLPHVRVVRPQFGVLTETVRISGSIEAREIVHAHARQSGLRVRRLLAEEGDTVVAGQLLAVLDTTELATARRAASADLARAEAALASASEDAEIARIDAQLAAAELARTERLSGQGVASTEVLDQRRAAGDRAVARLRLAESAQAVTRAARDIARANLDAANEALAEAWIRAPVGGRILTRSAEMGGRADVLFSIAADGEMDLVGTALQADFLRLAPGMDAEVTPTGGASVPGRVGRLSGTVDPATRLGRVRIALPAAPGLVAGAFAHGVVAVAQIDGMVLPASSIGGGTVWIVRDGVVHARPVATGAALDGLVPVAGLSATDSVVLRHDSFVAEGMSVVPVETAWDLPLPLSIRAEAVR